MPNTRLLSPGGLGMMLGQYIWHSDRTFTQTGIKRGSGKKCESKVLYVKFTRWKCCFAFARIITEGFVKEFRPANIFN